MNHLYDLPPYHIFGKFQNIKVIILIICLLGSQLLFCEKSTESGKSKTGSWESMDSGTTGHFFSVWGSSPTNVFAAGDLGIFHFDGTSWIRQTGDDDGSFTDMSAFSSSSIYAVGPLGIFHYDGVGWSECCSMGDKEFDQIWAESSTEFYAVSGLEVWHFDGTDWDQFDSLPHVVGSISGVTEQLHPVISEQVTTLWTAGTDGMYTSFNKLPWLAEQGGITFDVWGSSWDDIYLAGWYGNLRHFDGEQWSHPNTEIKANLYGVHGNNNGEMFVVGLAGTIMKKNGDSWYSMESGVTNSLYDVWVLPDGEAFAVGSSGVILHYKVD